MSLVVFIKQGEGLEKVRLQPWSDPLGKCLQLTGNILEIAGHCGVPCIGLLGQALTVGSNILSGGDVRVKTQRTFREFHKEINH